MFACSLKTCSNVIFSVFRIFIVIFVASTFFTGMAFYFIVIYTIFASDVIYFVPECIMQLYLNQTIFIAVNNYIVSPTFWLYQCHEILNE